MAFAAFAGGLVAFAWRPSPLTACLLILPLRGGAMLVAAGLRGLRAVGWICVVGVALFYGLAFSWALAMMYFLSWTTPWWIRVAAAVTSFIVIVGRMLPGRVRWPILLPLGLWTMACVRGWDVQEGYVRCDDYLAIRPPVEIVVPIRDDLAQCHPGESLPIHRYPRTTWEYPDGRVLFTSKLGNEAAREPGSADTVREVICESPPEGTANPHCVGGIRGKSHGIAPAPDRDRVFIGLYGLPTDHPQDPPSIGRVVTAPLDGPLTVLSAHDYPGNVGGELIYESDGVLLLMGDDFMSARVSADDFSPLESGSVRPSPGEVRYDAQRHEGVICGAVLTDQMGLVYLAALQGTPPAARPLIRWSYSPISRLISWGCDWDLQGRKVYAAVPALGLLARIGYDSGEVEETFFVGFGMRSVAWDARRRRIYLTQFFAGEVVAIDADSGKEVGRWFVGRFPCQVRLSRDGRSLLTGSTAGLMRIRLDDP